MPKRSWTLVTSHGLTLCYLTANPKSTLRQVSDDLGISERQVARIVRDLNEAGILRVRRERARRNSYSVDLEAHFRHPVLSKVSLRKMVKALSPALADGRTRL